MVESATDAITVKDTRGRYVLANQAATALGFPLEGLIGRNDTELFQ